MSWVLLSFAIVFEIAGTMSAKISHGFTRLLPSLSMFACYACSMTLFNLSLKRIDVSIAYAVWAGVGTLAAALLGILYFKESLTVWKTVFMALIIVGAVGLNIASRGQQ